MYSSRTHPKSVGDARRLVPSYVPATQWVHSTLVTAEYSNNVSQPWRLLDPTSSIVVGVSSGSSFLAPGREYKIPYICAGLSRVLRLRRPSANSLIRECLKQVLRNRKNGRRTFPCSVIAFVLDRKYKYGRRFVRYQLVTKVSWYQAVNYVDSFPVSANI